jgi:hypothetical protein
MKKDVLDNTFFFFWFFSTWLISNILSSSPLIQSSVASNLLLIPSGVFLFQLLYSSSLIFLYIQSLCWSSEFIHSSLEFDEHFYGY